MARYAAIHESGHAIAAWYIGSPVSFMEFVDGSGAQEETLARTESGCIYHPGSWDPRFARREHFEFAVSQAIVDVAGVVAEAKFLGVAFEERWLTSGAGDEEKIQAICRDWTEPEGQRIREAAREIAVRLVDAGWRGVEALAERLLAEKRLERSTIEDVLTGAWPDVSQLSGAPRLFGLRAEPAPE